MAATDVTRARDGVQHSKNGTGVVRRLTTETKAAFKTTEFFAYLAVLAGLLIAGLVVDGGDRGGFSPEETWRYATILTVGYMISRGLAKAGSRQPYDENDDDRR